MSIAESKSLEEIYKNSLTVPSYQRPYKWTKDQVTPLIEDLYIFFNNYKKNENNIPVLLGSVILFCNKETNTMDVVDGQQRLTTLTILIHCLGETVPFLNQKFIHQTSIDNIKANKKIIDDFILKKDINKSEWAEFIIKHVYFIQINAPTLDDAFIFFDSQNNRGKTLADYDVLKAHHLRYIFSNDLATSCAKDWEKIDKENVLGYLLDTLLGRGRKWSRQEYERLSIKEEFKSQRSNKNDNRTYPLNRYHQPPIFNKWEYQHEKEQPPIFYFNRDFDAVAGTARITLQAHSFNFLPFQITQTLEGGELFFWYTQKYYEISKALFSDDNAYISDFFREIDKKAKNLAQSNSGTKHVYNVWKGAMIFYYDKFEYIEFDKAAAYFFYSIYFLRIENPRISEASIYKYIREAFNPFWIIQHASYHKFIFNEIDKMMEGEYTVEKLKTARDKKGIRKELYDTFYAPYILDCPGMTLPDFIRNPLKKIKQE